MARLVSVITMNLGEIDAAIDEVRNLRYSRRQPEWLLEELEAMARSGSIIDFHRDGLRLDAVPSTGFHALLACMREQPLRSAC